MANIMYTTESEESRKRAQAELLVPDPPAAAALFTKPETDEPKTPEVLRRQDGARGEPAA